MLDLNFRLDVPLRYEGQIPSEVIVSETHEAGRDLHGRFHQEWPIDTGRSRDGWELKLEREDFVLTNDVPYTGFITTGQPVLRRNLVRSADELSQRLAEQLPGAILNEVKHG